MRGSSVATSFKKSGGAMAPLVMPVLPSEFRFRAVVTGEHAFPGGKSISREVQAFACFSTEASNLFRTADQFQPGIMMETGPE